MMNDCLVCGVDEAGRGPLAGAVFAAAVILDPGDPIIGLADSKTLSESKRQQLAAEIRQRAFAWAVASSSVEEIDAMNILQASLLAMKRAVEALSASDGQGIVPHRVLVDGLHCPKISLPTQAIVKGDSKEPAIAAASILAKTARDEEMRALHLLYPQYDFLTHKGYPTKAHMQSLQQHGVSPIHRRSYGPVKKLLSV
jgi:ribonuclease HII